MDEASFHGLSYAEFRTRVPVATAATIIDADIAATVEQNLRELMASWSDADIDSARAAIANVGAEGVLNEANPLIREAGRVWTRAVLANSRLEGVEHLASVAEGRPVAVVCNHQSYIDSNAIDLILSSHDQDALAARFVSAAGPKVYDGLFRRVASASLNTIPVPQSTAFGHTEKLSRRELARRSLTAVSESHAAMRQGYVLLIYPEGSRTRTGKLQPFLSAVYRYFKQPGTVLVPAALEGTSTVMGVGASGIRPSPCTLRFGPAIDVDEVGGPRSALDVAATRVAELF
jgi:1-acyl-sn-glycerol-3-phosphate acyltransferase